MSGGEGAGRLVGRTAWVTGAGSGIGRAIAIALAAEGARLALTGRREDKLRETAGLLPSGAGEALVVPADLTDAAMVGRAAQEVADRLGGPDILVNNAGTNILRRHWHQLTPDGVRQLIDGNLTAPFLTSLAVLPAMKARGGGLIVQIASMAAKHTKGPSGPGYVAAKHGFAALSATLNDENNIHNIRSTVICPGEVNTPILDLRPEPVPEEERARMLQPEDIAAAVLFVATLPERVCIPEILATPTHNRAQAPNAHRISQLP